MFYADLTPYQYKVTTGLPGTANVGWLDGDAEFASVDISAHAAATLLELCQTPVNLMRGRHTCTYCGNAVGNGEIWLASSEVIYVAPALIGHYVQVHRYGPPEDFVRTVEAGSYKALDADEVEEILEAHWSKLERGPTPDDIVVDYFDIQLVWRLAAFQAFAEFEAALAHLGFHQPSIACTDKGFLLLTEGHDPGAVLRSYIGQCEVGGVPAPWKCNYKLVRLGEPSGEVLA